VPNGPFFLLLMGLAPFSFLRSRMLESGRPPPALAGSIIDGTLDSERAAELWCACSFRLLTALGRFERVSVTARDGSNAASNVLIYFVRQIG